MSTTKKIGDCGEAIVAQYLQKNGYRLLSSQWRCRYGELDLVVQDPQGVLCFVEVKLRSDVQHGLPREFVGKRKQTCLRRAAACYLSRYELDEMPVRFDVAEVYTDSEQRAFRIEYLKDAFI